MGEERCDLSLACRNISDGPESWEGLGGYEEGVVAVEALARTVLAVGEHLVEQRLGDDDVADGVGGGISAESDAGSTDGGGAAVLAFAPGAVVVAATAPPVDAAAPVLAARRVSDSGAAAVVRPLAAPALVLAGAAAVGLRVAAPAPDAAAPQAGTRTPAALASAPLCRH